MAIATDNFNRGSIGSNWTNVTGTLTLNSNRVTGSAGGHCVGFFNARTFAPAQYSQGTVTIGTDWAGLCVRASANNAYMIIVASGDWEMVKNVGGTFSYIVTGSATFATNDILRLEVEGTTLRLYRNGTLVTSAEDSSLSSGSPGVTFYSSDATHDAFMDNWEGGDLHNELIGRDTRYLINHPIYRR